MGFSNGISLPLDLERAMYPEAGRCRGCQKLIGWRSDIGCHQCGAWLCEECAGERELCPRCKEVSDER